MAAQIVSFFQRRAQPATTGVNDWSQQELAEFYRVESALMRAGLRVETDRGVSDEGEPWFVFLRAEDGEVVIHFARIDGEYLIAGPAYERVARGFDFSALVRNMIARHPLIQPQRPGSNVLMHPAALLIAIVGTAFFKSGEAKAMDDGKAPAARKSHALTLTTTSLPALAAGAAQAHSIYIEANQAMALLAGAMFVLDQRGAPQERSMAGLANPLQPTPQSAAAPSVEHVAAPVAAFEDVGSGTPALLTQQASAVLSLIAVLSTLDAGQGALAQPIAAVAPTELAHGGVQAAILSASTGFAQPPVYMEVQLRAGSMPTVQSVQLIREIADGQGFEKIAVVALERLPEAIAEIIAGGNDLNVVNHQPDFSGATPSNEAPPEAGPDGAPAPAPTSPGVEIPVVVAPAPTPAPVTDAYKAMAQKLIAYFVAHVPDVEILTAGTEVVFYDTRILSNASELVHIDSVTFHFADGSSVSLVGEHSALYQDPAWG